MSLKDRIDQDIKEAMKAKDKERLSALRSIKSALLTASTEKGAGGNVDEKAELQLLKKQLKQRKESIEVYKEQGRDDLVSEEEKQAEVIQEYLPEQMGEEELEQELKKIIQEVGAQDPSDMGKVMGKAMQALGDKADGGMIKEKVQSLLSG